MRDEAAHGTGITVRPANYCGVPTAAMLPAPCLNSRGGLGQNPMMGHFFAPVIFGGALTRYIRKFISWHTHAEMREYCMDPIQYPSIWT